jgi:hypothetical protein
MAQEANRQLVDLDFENNSLLNVVIDKLPSHPTSPVEGRIYYNTGDKTIYAWTGSVWLDLGDIYSHPSYGTLNPTLTGANVLASISVDSKGHVDGASTRILTLADLGYTGDSDANKYIHPTFSGNDLGSPLTGAKVISDVNVNNEGHVTAFVTRDLTPADIGAAVINDSVTNGINTWSSNKIQSELDAINNKVAGALVYKGGYNANTNTPNLDSSPSGITQGYTYTVTTGGTFFGTDVQVGDMIIAEKNNPTVEADWTIVNKNIPDIVDATTTEKGIIRIATQSEVDAGNSSDTVVTPATLVAFYNAQETSKGVATSIGNGTATLFDVNHSLNTRDVQVELYDNNTYETVYAKILRTTTTNVRVLVNNPLDTNELRVVITAR